MASLVTIPNTVMKSLKYCVNHELWQTHSEHMLGSSADGRVGTNLQFCKNLKWSEAHRQGLKLPWVAWCPAFHHLEWWSPRGHLAAPVFPGEKFPETAVWAMEAFFDNLMQLSGTCWLRRWCPKSSLLRVSLKSKLCSPTWPCRLGRVGTAWWLALSTLALNVGASL